MKKITLFLIIFSLAFTLNACDTNPSQVTNQSRTSNSDLTKLWNYMQQNGERISSDEAYSIISTDRFDSDIVYLLNVKQNGEIILAVLDINSVFELAVRAKYQYGRLSNRFELTYTYENSYFDDYGYDDDALYLPSTGEVIVVFDEYTGNTRSFDEEYATEYAEKLMLWASNWFRTNIGVPFV